MNGLLGYNWFWLLVMGAGYLILMAGVVGIWMVVWCLAKLADVLDHETHEIHEKGNRFEAEDLYDQRVM